MQERVGWGNGVKDHFRILEFWRIFAAFMVMVFHFLNYGPPAAVAATEFLYRLLPMMDMFFMVSGFLIMARYADSLMVRRGSYARFLGRRLARFYPLYLVTTLFFVALAVAVHLGLYQTGNPERYALSALPANLLLMQAWGLTDTLTYNYVGWTLSSEWFCYLALPVIVLAYRRAGLRGLAIVIAASILALELAIAADLVPFDSWMRADTWGAYRAFVDFAIGALIAIVVRDTRWRLHSHAPVWIVFGLTIVMMMVAGASYYSLLMLSLSVYLAALAERTNPAGAAPLKLFDPLGRVSFSIYLIHPVVAAILFGLVWRQVLAPMGMVSFYPFALMAVLVVTALSLASYHWFETPVGNWLQDRFDRWLDRRLSLERSIPSATARAG